MSRLVLFQKGCRPLLKKREGQNTGIEIHVSFSRDGKAEKEKQEFIWLYLDPGEVYEINTGKLNVKVLRLGNWF